MLYEIPEVNVAALVKRLERLSARTVKAGNPAIRFNKTGQHRDVPHPQKPNTLVRLVEVEVTTETPAYNGWNFLASICQTEEGNVIRAIPGYDVPGEYREGDHRCDHCNTVRRRRDTYIVRHDDGRTLRVGSSCLRDFLQHASPSQLTTAARYCFEAHSLGESAQHASWLGGAGPVQPYRVDLEEFLVYVAQTVLTDGYFVTRKLARERGTCSTSQFAMNMMLGGAREMEITSEARQLAQTAREWVLASFCALDLDNPDLDGQDILDGLTSVSKNTNDFEHNLYVVARSEAIEPRLAGIAAYIVEAYRRSLPKPEVAVSSFVGEPKARLRDIEVTFTKVVQREADGYNTMYDKTFCVMRDAAGNVLVWSASGLQDFETGKPYILTGTVKEHSTYKGVCQTILSRCIINPKLAEAA